jgi:uncharacterized membrane protein
MNPFSSPETDDQNLLAVTKSFLTSLKVRITYSEIEEAMLKNPNYPTLAALTDLLDDYHVDNIALNTSVEYLDQMVFPAVAHVHENGSKFVMLSGLEGDKIRYLDLRQQWKREPIAEFGKKWTGNLVMAEASGQSGDPAFGRKRWLERAGRLRVPVLSGLLVALAAGALWLSPSWPVAGLLVTLLAGMLVSVAIIRVESNQESTLAGKVCTPGAHTDCRQVLSSPAATWFGWLHVSDLGAVYFAGSFLTVLLGSLSGRLSPLLSLLAVLNVLALPYTFFSVYYQYRVVRKWCTLCLLVQALLWIEFVVLRPFLFRLDPGALGAGTLLSVALGFLVPIVCLLAYDRNGTLNRQRAFRLEKELSEWKRDPHLFRTLLVQQPFIHTERAAGDLFLGKADAPLAITAVLNPDCPSCVTAYQELKQLLQKYDEDLRVDIRFLAPSGDPESESTQTTRQLLSIALHEGPGAFPRVMDAWATSRPGWAKSFPTTLHPGAGPLLKAHFDWCVGAGIGRTPSILIGNHLLPKRYGVKDLRHLLFK